MALFQFASTEPVCHMKEAFDCLDIIVDFINSQPKRSIGQTDEDVDNFCKSANESMSCFNEYRKRCMTPIQQELSDLLVEGIFNLRNQLCGSSTSPIRTNYLAHAECLNKVAQSDSTNNNLHYLLAIIERFVALPNSQRINFICCGYGKMYNAIRSDAVNTCGEEATKAGEDFINLSVAQLPRMICTGYDGSSDECKAVLPPDGAKPTDEFKDNAIYKFAYSVIKNYLE